MKKFPSKCLSLGSRNCLPQKLPLAKTGSERERLKPVQNWEDFKMWESQDDRYSCTITDYEVQSRTALHGPHQRF